MLKFKAVIEIIGINPYVFVPEEILHAIFKQARKDRGHIPIAGTINQKPYKQTLVKYSGHWRLYINTSMLKNSPKRIGEEIELTVGFDRESRAIETPEAFIIALNANVEAEEAFYKLSPSRKFEIIRYLARLKTEKALEYNISRAINFLKGKERFIGREKP